MAISHEAYNYVLKNITMLLFDNVAASFYVGRTRISCERRLMLVKTKLLSNKIWTREWHHDHIFLSTKTRIKKLSCRLSHDSTKIPYKFVFHTTGLAVKFIMLFMWSQHTSIPSSSFCCAWWRHNDHDGVSNHQSHGCLLNRLFRRRSKKTPKLRVTGLCVGTSPGPVNSPHKGPVTRKMFPFDDVIWWPGWSQYIVHFIPCYFSFSNYIRKHINPFPKTIS